MAGIGCTCRVTQMGLSGGELVVVYLLAIANISSRELLAGMRTVSSVISIIYDLTLTLHLFRSVNKTCTLLLI